MNGKVIRIAKIVREEVSSLALADGFYDDLGGYCAHASLLLSKIARRSNLEVSFILGNWVEDGKLDETLYGNHCWNLFNNKIIDLTATQFGIKDEIYITSPYESNIYQPMCMGGKAAKLIKRDFPKYQNPFKRVLDHRKMTQAILGKL